MGKTPAKYPAFRPRGQEIRVGDLVRRFPVSPGFALLSYDRGHAARSLGIVLSRPTLTGSTVRILWSTGILVVALETLEVLGESRWLGKVLWQRAHPFRPDQRCHSWFWSLWGRSLRAARREQSQLSATNSHRLGPLGSRSRLDFTESNRGDWWKSVTW